MLRLRDAAVRDRAGRRRRTSCGGTRMAGKRWCAVMLAVAVAGFGSIWTGSGERADAADVPAGFVDEQVLGGLELPTNVAFASDGRVFVAEKSGIIRGLRLTV